LPETNDEDVDMLVRMFEKDPDYFYDFLLAVNYCSLTSLLHLCCAFVASLIKGQPLDQIEKILKPVKADHPVRAKHDVD